MIHRIIRLSTFILVFLYRYWNIQNMRHGMKTKVLIFVFCLYSMTLAAQQVNYQIKGCLKDAESGQIIDFADIFLYEEGKEQPPFRTIPNEKGEFVFEQVVNGTYTMMIQLMGYDIFYSQPMKLTEQSRIDFGEIRLQPLEIGLSEVVVVARKQQLVYKLDKKVVDASSNLLGSGGSAADILENTPSVKVDAEGDISFRGSTGFLVYIDGKPSVFSGTQALEQVPAGQIENIEIITTPSAKHDTEGEVGIINICTKKHFTNGLSGMVNVSGSTWMTRRGDFLLNQQNKKSRFFLGGQWSDKLTKSRYEQQSITSYDGQTIALDAAGPHEGNKFNYSLKGGWSLELPKTIFSIEGEGGHGGRWHKGNMLYRETDMSDGENPVPVTYQNKNDFKNSENFGQGTLSFEHKFNDEGHQLSASFYYKYGGDSKEYSYNELLDEQGNREDGSCYYENEFRKTIRGNMDYVLPFLERGKLEAGYQYYSYLEDGDYELEWWNREAGRFDKQPEAYNTFLFKEEIHSVYAIVSGTWEKVEVQAGLRGEHTHTRLNSSIPNASRSDARFEVFPSLHAGYNLAHEQRLQVAYSYRTTRPQLWFMEPYITYNDFFSAVIGNPDIRPEYIHSFELSYQKDFGAGNISATLFHRYRKDKIERLRLPYERGMTLDSMANVGRDYSSGLELNSAWHPVRWWDTNLNMNIYHYLVKNELKAGGKSESSTNYDIMWNNLFVLGKYTRLQFDGCFVGPSVTTQGRSESYWYANIAVRQQLFNRKLTAVLAFKDIFRSACYQNNIRATDLWVYNKIKPKYPNISLTLSYTFNNFKGKLSSEKEDRNEMFEGKR